MGIKIKGLDKLTKDLKNFGEAGERVLIKRIDSSATKIQLDAIANMPFALNFIGQKISREYSNKGLTAKVGAQGSRKNPLPAYYEFGTGSNYLQLIAGNKNYDKDIQALAFTFKKTGDGTLPAQPYLFPAFFEERVKLLQKLKEQLDILAKSV